MAKPTFLDPETGMEFLQLSATKEKEFRRWARKNHQPGAEINPVWHPVVRDECKRIDAKAATA